MSKRSASKEIIASRLRLAREIAGLTQGQVAKYLGLHRPTVSEIEAGRRKVSAEEMFKIAELYGVSVTWVIGTEDSSSAASDRVELAARELGKLKDEDLDRLLQIIKALKTSEDS